MLTSTCIYKFIQKQSLLHLNDYEVIERKYRDLEGVLGKEKQTNQDLKSKLSATASELQRLTGQVRQNDNKK